MRFSNAKQVVGIMLCWAILLFAVDYQKNPGALRSYFEGMAPPPSAPAERPRIVLLMNHLCCTGCLDDVSGALRQLPWLGEAKIVRPDLPSTEEAEVQEGGTSYRNEITLEVVDVRAVDFMAIEAAVRGVGLSIARMEFSGLPHFRLVSEVKHLCCQQCAKAADEGFAIAMTLRATGQFTWLDSVQVSKEHRSVTAFARYDTTVNVTELVGALEHMGFAPSTVRVLPGDDS